MRKIGIDETYSTNKTKANPIKKQNESIIQDEKTKAKQGATSKNIYSI